MLTQVKQVQVMILSSHRQRVRLTVRDLGGRGGSYQYDGADGVGGQDVILQGSAVTLGLHVRGALVMELEEVRQPNWCQYTTFQGADGKTFYFASHSCCCCCFWGSFPLAGNHKQVFFVPGCKLGRRDL